MTARDGILILDSEDAIVVETNPFLTELLGYERQELLGRPLREIRFFEERAQAERLFEKVRREGYVHHDSLPLKRRDGSTILTELVANSYFVDDRGVIQLNISDVTGRPPSEEATARESAQPEPLPDGYLGNGAQIVLKTLLRTITSHARALLKADAGELFLYRSEQRALERALAVGAGGSRLSRQVRRGEGLAGRVWETGESVVLHNHPNGLPGGETVRGLSWRRALGAPIRWRGEFLGVLGVRSSRETPFSESDTELLDLLATQAAVALTNARLSSEIERIAVVDELTGVFNRRGLLTLGAREVERSRRLGRPLAMLFADLDHFKALNDDYSHEVGDKALREVSRRIHSSMRKIDMVARYGGEEFVVLLVETDLGPAVEVAERVRQVVEATNLATDRGPAHVTVSIGVTAGGSKTPDLEVLIRRADEAMYAAKQAGRNRVVALAS